MVIFPLVILFSAYIAAILSVGIAVTAKMGLILGIIAFVLIVAFPFFAEKDTCSRLGWLIWNGSVIVCSVVVYGWYSLLIFSVWTYWIYARKNANHLVPSPGSS